MCGRYNLITDGQALAEFFELVQALDLTPRYNIAPSQTVPVIRMGSSGARELAMLRWGLIPSWSKTSKSRYQMINARAETVAEKPAYRAAFRQRRCLIPATGFYEWQQKGRYKQPYNIQWRGGELMAFAGLWESWHDERQSERVDSFTIIVTDANDTIRPLHDRMPVILQRTDFQRWLDPEQDDAAELQTMLQPANANAISLYPVSRLVGNPGNDVQACIEPLADDMFDK